MLTTALVWPSLAVKAVMSQLYGEVMAVESPHPPIPAGEPSPALIADVREVPLGQLCGDADALRIVTRVIESTEGSARVRVAMFQSAI